MTMLIRRRVATILIVVINMIPLLVALGVTKFYFAAKDVLGHFPRPSIDDPKNLPIWSDYAFLGDWLCFSYLVLLITPFLIGIFRKKLPSADQKIVAAMILTNWIVYICLHTVPGIDVLEWYLD